MTTIKSRIEKAEKTMNLVRYATLEDILRAIEAKETGREIECPPLHPRMEKLLQELARKSGKPDYDEI